MYWRDIGLLCREKTGTDGSPLLDSLRKPVKDFEKRQVFCNKKSVRQSEFYQAQAQGFRPEYMFEVRSQEYGGEQYFEYSEWGIPRMFRIIRTYDRNGEITELICNSLVVDDG